MRDKDRMNNSLLMVEYLKWRKITGKPIALCEYTVRIFKRHINIKKRAGMRLPDAVWPFPFALGI